MTDASTEDRDLVIVAALAGGATYEQAAEVAGCSRATVARRVADPEVRAAVDDERTRLARATADLLAGATRAAIERLSKVVDTGSPREATHAARTLLDMAVRHREAAYVVEEVARLREDVEAIRREADQ